MLHVQESKQTSVDVFSVAMPNLVTEPPQCKMIDDGLRAGFAFLANTEMPEEPELGPDFLEPMLDKADESTCLPPRLTVVLDLDETLSHCRLRQLASPRPDFSVEFEESQQTGFVYVRPFTGLFLEVAAQLFEIVVFTASSQDYADQVLDKLDPDNRYFSARLYRQHCTEAAGGYLKDLRRMGRPMERIVLVDNSPVSLALCPDNGVLVSSWTAEQTDDRELLELLVLLQQCMVHGSVADFLAQRYSLREFAQLIKRRPELLTA